MTSTKPSRLLVFTFALAALAVLLGLARPGHALAAEPFLGKWKLVGVITAEGPVPKEKLAGGGMSWDFKAGGEAIVTVWKGEESKSVTTTWTVTGDKLTVVENGAPNEMTYKLKGKAMTLSKGTVSLQLKRARK